MSKLQETPPTREYTPFASLDFISLGGIYGDPTRILAVSAADILETTDLPTDARVEIDQDSREISYVEGDFSLTATLPKLTVRYAKVELTANEDPTRRNGFQRILDKLNQLDPIARMSRALKCIEKVLIQTAIPYIIFDVDTRWDAAYADSGMPLFLLEREYTPERFGYLTRYNKKLADPFEAYERETEAIKNAYPDSPLSRLETPTDS